MIAKNHVSELPNQPRHPKLKKLSSSLAKIVILLGIMILVAGHENLNPHIGDSHIDFYADKSKELIRIKTNSLYLDSEIDSVEDIALLVNQLVADLYRARDYRPIWTINYSTTEPFNSLLEIMDSSMFYGFPVDYFNISLLKQYNRNVASISAENEDISKRIELEIQASRSAVLLMIYLNQGIVNQVDSNYYSFLKSIPQTLNNTVAKGTIKTTLHKIQPVGSAYQNLLKSSTDFIRLASELKTHSFETIPDSILALAFHYSGVSSSMAFDSLNTKQKSVSTFNKKYGLIKADTLNSAMYEKLASVIQYRYYQVCLNFDRLRKLNNANQDYLFVNIPEFKLHVIENQALIEQYNVIVGKTKSPTPIISSEINKIVANPFWTVPRSIANNEMLYKIRKDSTYLNRNGYFIINNREEMVSEELIDWEDNDPLAKQYWIRQKNSRANALGQVKFLFPNRYNVYLHDTPSKRLFKKQKRAFSHGCVRLENPDKLAQYLAGKLIEEEAGKTIDMKAAIKSSKRKVFELDSKMEIHIQYITCLGDKSGTLRFFNDIYKKDSKEINLLFPVDIAM